MIEELSKELSLRLAEKLENGEISIREMAVIIDKFLKLVGEAGGEKLKVFVSKV